MSVAVGARIDFSIDLNDVAKGDGYLFVRDGIGFAGWGIALETTASVATSVLGAIETVAQRDGDADQRPIAEFVTMPIVQ